MASGDGCCRISVIKAILYAYQFVFLVTGLGICSVGVWKFLTTYHYFNASDMHSYAAVLYLFIITGCLVICAFTFGCCAIPKNRTKLIFCFILILVFVFLMESLVAMLAYVYQHSIEEDVRVRLNSSLLNDYNLARDKTRSIDIVHQELKCCGAQTFSDWKYSEWLENASLPNKVPDSCCKTVLPDCGVRDHPSNIFRAGCEEKVAYALKFSLWIMCAVCLGVSVVQVIGVVFSIKLFLKLELIDRNYNPQFNGNESLVSTF
ncbi:CD151 antigen-like [Cylas formicarius]|uniref:CD151 antigen-like n=1 Tax=Cylas formicarius TaxID=197179 RepID=UPI0029588CAE|nr:CD151 antigen-like [Cylas formicarius]